MAKMDVLELLDSLKLISRKNMNDRKIVKFPHCVRSSLNRKSAICKCNQSRNVFVNCNDVKHVHKYSLYFYVLFRGVLLFLRGKIISFILVRISDSILYFIYEKVFAAQSDETSPLEYQKRSNAEGELLLVRQEKKV